MPRPTAQPLTRALFVLTTLLTLAGCTSVAVMDVQPFGAADKAEFYRALTNPALGDATFVFRVNSGQTYAVLSPPLLTAADLAAVTVDDVTGPFPAKRVSATLTPSGRLKVSRHIADTSPNQPVVLVWNNQVHYEYPADLLNTNAPVVLADDLPDAMATDLADALR